jgi:hypothetical protein
MFVFIFGIARELQLKTEHNMRKIVLQSILPEKEM